MADHASGSRAEIASQAASLRAELKTWEKAFASANSGKKAGRDDIKQNPEIGMSGDLSFGRQEILDIVDPKTDCDSCQIQGIQSAQIPRVLP